MRVFFIVLLVIAGKAVVSQTNFAFDFGNAGQRVCLATATVTTSPASVTLHLNDASGNSNQSTDIY